MRLFLFGETRLKGVLMVAQRDHDGLVRMVRGLTDDELQRCLRGDFSYRLLREFKVERKRRLAQRSA